jgi:outer membrane protein insertion porin family
MSKIRLSSLWVAIAAATLAAPGITHAEETVQPNPRSNVRSNPQADDPERDIGQGKALPPSLQPNLQANGQPAAKPKVRLQPHPTHSSESNSPNTGTSASLPAIPAALPAALPAATSPETISNAGDRAPDASQLTQLTIVPSEVTLPIAAMVEYPDNGQNPVANNPPTPIELNPVAQQQPPGTRPPTSQPQPAQPQPAQPQPAQPAQPQPAQPPGTRPPGTSQPRQPQPQVLVSEVVIRPANGTLPADLEDIAYSVIATQPGRTTDRARLIQDANAIYATGYFANVEPSAEETPLGVRVVFTVEANPLLTKVTVTGNEVLQQSQLDEFFGEQYGQILNFKDFQAGINRVNQWYQDNGYVLAQVIDPVPLEDGGISPPSVAPNGTVTLEVAEGVVEDIEIRFRGDDGESEDPDGNPIRGRTQEYVITREMRLKPGDVFNREVLLEDLQRIVRLGLFEDAEFSAEPGADPRKVVLVLNATEGSFGSFNFGGGFSSASGLFGSVGAEFLNIGGRNQRLGGEVQVGERGAFFDLRFTNPWIKGDPYRTSYTLNAFNRRSISLVFDGSENGDRQEVRLDNGDRPRVQRLGGNITFNRPLSRDPLTRAEWVASLGLEYENVSIRDGDGDRSPEDEDGNQLSLGEDGTDNLLSVQFGLSRDRRNNALQPTSGSLLRLSTDQYVPIDGIFGNRIRAGYSYYLPVKFTDFSDGPQALAFNFEAGTFLGDLPPYEAFVLGGTNSVRGFEEGDVGVGRSFAQATVEYRFPVFSVVSGALFLDAATAFGTQDNVPGDPGNARNKPGHGIGYGIGVRIQSPIGPIRVDYGVNNEGDNRFHFGLGERF